MPNSFTDTREFGADVTLRTVSTYLVGETGIECVTFVLRGKAFGAFQRRLRTI